MNNNNGYAELRRVRRGLDLTLDRVASMTGVSVGYLNRIERGYISRIRNPQKEKAIMDFIRKYRRQYNKRLNDMR